MNIALIIAGGSGERMKQDIPKQFLTVMEKPVIVYTMEAFQKHAEINAIAVVCIKGWEQILWAYAKQFNITKLKHQEEIVGRHPFEMVYLSWKSTMMEMILSLFTMP